MEDLPQCSIEIGMAQKAWLEAKGARPVDKNACFWCVSPKMPQKEIEIDFKSVFNRIYKRFTARLGQGAVKNERKI